MKKNPSAIFVAATKQHVGKTTTCLALMKGAQNLLGEARDGSSRVGFIKPVGQRHVVVDGGLKVDKDVVLFKEHFKLDKCKWNDLSPVVMPAGYTRDFLDGKVTEQGQIAAVESAFRNISSMHDMTIVEGTGHCGVGSIVNLDNARVASLLGLEMLLVVNGGLGSAFDELAVQRCVCAQHGVNIRGVLLNKVMPDKVDMVTEYFQKALSRWNMPLVGVVPDAEYLASPSMLDYEQLFKTKVVVGQEHILRHYDNITLVAMDLRRFAKRLRTEKHTKTLFVTHASRLDIVLAFVSHSLIHERIWGEPFKAGLILAGGHDVEEEEKKTIVEALNGQDQCAALFSTRSTYDTLLWMGTYTAKLSALDTKRTELAISHYCQYIDWNKAFGAIG